MRDPFLIVQEEVEGTYKKLNQAFLEWDAKTEQDPLKDESAQIVLRLLESVSWQVRELEKAVQVSEKNPSRFGLKKEEIVKRRRWTNTTLQELDQIRQHISRAKKPNEFPASGPMSPEMSNFVVHDDYLDSELQDRQSLLIRRQEEDLDVLSQSVTRLGQVGLEIGEELDHQSRIISEFDDEMDTLTTKIAGARRKISYIAKKSGLKGQLCLIIVLIVILGLLVTIVFS